LSIIGFVDTESCTVGFDLKLSGHFVSPVLDRTALSMYVM